MRRTAILALLSSAVIAQELGPAAVIEDNPAGAKYVATFPDSEDNTVRGTVTASSAEDGVGVNFDVAIDGLPAEGGPFAYHLHDQPVPEDGNCTKTLAHLDPYKRGQEVPCDTASPETCEVGDLSGKWGKMNSPSHSAQFLELYASTKEGIGAFFGNRSVVVHYANSSRITCANFVMDSEDTYPTVTSEAPYPTGYPTGAPNGTEPNATTTYAPPTVSEDAAAHTFVGTGVMIAGLVAMLL